MLKVTPILLLVLLAGCSRERGLLEDDRPTVERETYGDVYWIVSHFNEGDPDLYPMLIEDSLIVRLVYAGGCKSHEFDVRHSAESDTAFVWLFHDAQGDTCEALVHDEVGQRLPDAVLSARVIALHHPQPGPPQVLRGGGQ